MIRRPPRSTLLASSAASDVYKRQLQPNSDGLQPSRFLLSPFSGLEVNFALQTRDDKSAFVQGDLECLSLGEYLGTSQKCHLRLQPFRQAPKLFERPISIAYSHSHCDALPLASRLTITASLRSELFTKPNVARRTFTELLHYTNIHLRSKDATRGSWPYY